LDYNMCRPAENGSCLIRQEHSVTCGGTCKIYMCSDVDPSPNPNDSCAKGCDCTGNVYAEYPQWTTIHTC
jgi:hypothetical protein